MNLKTARLLYPIAWSIFLSVTARAELKWEQTQVELHPDVGDKEAVGHFKYENTGDKPVRFKSIRTSCGCTVAQTQKEEVPPGEKGEITATLKIGGRTGFGSVKQKMAEFMKQDEELLSGGEPAVNGDKIVAQDAIVKAARREWHLLNLDLKPPAKPVKVGFRERALVPADTQFFDLVGEKTHNG